MSQWALLPFPLAKGRDRVLVVMVAVRWSCWDSQSVSLFSFHEYATKDNKRKQEVSKAINQ
ncbi:hypothetical protein F2Q69_00022885 [Brassica cretica]|uniref:Uncharacterized protein n=1 Tax=Brassica cretica TaxID=69181 RepID=A0A8S9Q9P4_BRACR|nr:hypothetical protein F2Q69_00022885 [Brassica cretica]